MSKKRMDAGAHRMGEPSGEDETGGMPGGTMEASTSGGGMPSARMGGGDDPASGGMPSARMDGGGGGGEQLPRFVPEGAQPGELPSPRWEPGVVEVEFRDNVRPELVSAASGAPAEVRSPAGPGLDEFNRIVRLNGLQAAEPSFLTTPEEATAAQEMATTQGIEAPNPLNFVTLHFPPETDLARVAQELAALPEVERAVPVPIAIPASATLEAAADPEASVAQIQVPGIMAPPAPPPVAPLLEPRVGTTTTVVVDPVTTLDNQWYVFRCRVNEAWNLGASGNGVVVSDIDWGYRTTHEELSGRLDLANAYNAYDGGTNVSTGSSVSHGTSVMGLAGAAVNSRGIAGVAYRASLWPVQADTGPGPFLGGNAWARAIDWVRTRPSGGKRKVIILEVQTGSYGNYEMVPSVNAAIKLAIASGVVVCVAAGNGNRSAELDDSGNPIPPTGSILVGATAYDPAQNPRAWFSNFGSTVVVSAPGDPSHDVTCTSTSNTAYTNHFGGTSGATPKVAGVAAMMLEVNPALSHAQVRSILNVTGGPVVTDPARPVGRFLNAGQAVRAARPAAWHPFAYLNGTCDHGCAVASWGAGRLDAFVIGSNGQLHTRYFAGGAWSGYASLGGVCISAPAAVSRAANRIDAFVLGVDSGVWQRSWNGAAWTPFTSLGGVCHYSPAVASWGVNRLDLFVIGVDNALYQNYWNGLTWSGWIHMGGVCIASPAAVSRAPNRLDVFVIGVNNALYHRSWNGAAWSGFTSLGGACKLGVAAAAWSANRMDVFVIGMDNALYQRYWENGVWSGWINLGGWCISAPAAVAPEPNRLDVFVLSTDSALYQRTWS